MLLALARRRAMTALGRSPDEVRYATFAGMVSVSALCVLGCGQRVWIPFAAGYSLWTVGSATGPS